MWLRTRTRTHTHRARENCKNEALSSNFSPGGRAVYSQIKLRRTEAQTSAHCIAFHLDYSRRTMQVPLNGATEFEGGQLVYATADGLTRPVQHFRRLLISYQNYHV